MDNGDDNGNRSGHLDASFHHDGSVTVAAPNGGLAHRVHVAHSERFERRLWPVTDGVWCLVGNGLSNQTFVEGPGGLIAIDTGESSEEMQSALDAVAGATSAPVVAVIYTHFHYVGGTGAVTERFGDVEIWGHDRIETNRHRAATEMGPAVRTGLVHQFGLTLPDDGPDALVNVGLGPSFRRAEHAPFTQAFVAPTRTMSDPVTTTIAGLRVELTPAPSDADDSITIWFPDLGVCVDNLVWPALFNVFAIRGEEYRDPRILLDGFDHIIGLGAEHLVGTHGPPISGAATVETETTRSRDAVQFLWDQTVRGINKGLTAGELTQLVRLPASLSTSCQQQLYGVAEHHVRQIHAGLRGWFDGDESTLFPVPPIERAGKLVAGFGGREAVRTAIAEAVDADDLRWALELAGWLIRLCDAHDDDRIRAADILRLIGRRTTAANIRNWCLTRARHLDGTARTDHFHTHRFARTAALEAPLGDTLFTLRVMLDPDRCVDADRHIAVDVGDDRAGLHVRHGVAVPTDGTGAALTLRTTRSTWADLLTGSLTLTAALDAASITVDGGTSDDARRVLAWFEHAAFQS